MKGETKEKEVNLMGRKRKEENVYQEGLKYEIACPHCGGGIIMEKEVTRRGKLAGLTLPEMTDEQLKRELINAKSVLYKAQKRGANEDVIKANQARVDAAEAEKASRAPEPAPAPEETEDAVE